MYSRLEIQKSERHELSTLNNNSAGAEKALSLDSATQYQLPENKEEGAQAGVRPQWNKRTSEGTLKISRESSPLMDHSSPLTRTKGLTDSLAKKLRIEMEKPITKPLENYEIIRTLGTGTFGRVFLTKHKAHNQYLALKKMKKNEVVRSNQIAHVFSEKTLLAAAKHPFIVNLFETFQDPLNLYISMEFISGGELFTRLRTMGRFDVDTVRFYSAQVVIAFAYMHSKNIIYRDLKPENIMIDKTGYIKLTDFGFAKEVEDQTWTLCGTPEYLAPELIRCLGYGKAADWWAVGILIYEMAVGYPPFYDESPFAIYEQILVGQVRWPEEIDADCKDLVEHFLEADISKRYGQLKDGVKDIQNHPFYKGVDWDQIEKRLVEPAYIPEVKGPGDASMFEEYAEEEAEVIAPDTQDPYRVYFLDF